MLYLISVEKKDFGRIISKAESHSGIRFAKNFRIKTGQLDPDASMIVDVSFDADAKSWGFDPWVATWEGPDADDPYVSASTEEEAFFEFIEMMRGHND